ncbi:adenine deaminase [Clostridium fermenticellae]|uniref:Adenine deaminase n=1 Tax=Clostridium fermenticellae TaxID=2068654 RepID=A0A386H402_9CLOT|nr:adenine deaminase [Clostridium fermenticellae]AYD40396.1 adenine deaminase [Clostridium fermenticellae]
MIDILKKQKAANGIEDADIVLKGGNIINVFTEEIVKADVAIVGKTIVGIGNYSGNLEIDCTGKYIMPGFIDAHMHLESTMVMPNELSKVILKFGTTTLIADPHEMVNVKGEAALDFLIDAVEQSPVNIYIMIPSSVPATEFETNGAGDFLAQNMVRYKENPRILGLGEVMCFRDVVKSKKHILDKLNLFEGKIVDGHAPGLSGKELQCYRLSGIDNDHEITTTDEVIEKMRAGFYILIREGSGARNLNEIIGGILSNGLPFERCMFCTDDKHLDDIEREGHINYNVKKAIEIGVSPIKAIKMATYYPSLAYGLKDYGAIAAGYAADIIVSKDLKDMDIDCVLKDGHIVNGEYLDSLKHVTPNKELLNTVYFEDITEDKLKVELREKNDIIGLMKNQLTTKHIVENIPGKNNVFIPNDEYSKLCVVERHGKTHNVSAAPLKGFGIKSAAIATTVAHDSHNIIAAGDNDRDIIKAVNHLKQIQGGYVIVSGGKVIDALQLRVAGLISELDSDTVKNKVKDMVKLARSMGIKEGIDPFLTLSFLALPVIPEIRLTDKGLIDVNSGKIIG